MTKLQRQEFKEEKLTRLKKKIDSMSYYSMEQFKHDYKAYVNAVRSGRILYDVIHVTPSGQHRDIKIRSYEGTMRKGGYRNYILMLEALDFTLTTSPEMAIRVYGLGMNMLSVVNDNIFRDLFLMGFVTRKTFDELSQKVQ